ncbi:hypothetical protein P0092_12350 [Ruminiclostridium papyrosolvens DSM 2782]|nr:hypothetical protein [Ruminiclostridium papyrosolvens]WES32552.1 hypothetical protein P0092_12350 [Ruminiclostridium papyrosolvens DSM 2782]
MMKFITKIINNTIETGIGQSIIAFAAWGYSFFLVVVVLYYAVISLIKLISGNKN